ncbi:MAG: reverse transcriptase/maturase family protein [bacterium]|nr:reverse transcriptase/maturase family protein [bacterium]
MFTHKYQDIISLENLLATWDRFVRGKRHKKDVIAFQLNLADNLIELHGSLRDRTYKHGGYHAFNISDPKPRNIHKATVRDRVLHHLIYKELYRYFDSRFIYDSFSCRKGKGTHRALDRFKYFAGQVSKNYTRTCYVLKGDIKKFFASIDHVVLMKILERHIEDGELRALLREIVSSFHSAIPTIGLPLGNLTSQLLVNIYMHEFDMYVKQELRVKYYIRYADDFAVLSSDKKYLEELLPEFHYFLNNKLHLSLHENKVYIKTYGSGVDFLGWVHFPYHRQIRTATKKKIIKKLRGYPKPQTINSYRGVLGHGNTHKVQERVGVFRFF